MSRASGGRERGRAVRGTVPRLRRLCVLGGAVLLLPALAAAAEAGPPNPLRGQREAIESGAALYEEHCASCHGAGAVNPMAEGPDLRRLDGLCKRIAPSQAALVPRCLQDVDAYFLESVQDGKWRAGHFHMPPWRDKLGATEIWSIRSFIETRPAPQRRTLPDLPPVESR